MAFRLHSRLLSDISFSAEAFAALSNRKSSSSFTAPPPWRKAYVQVQTGISDPVDLAGNISRLLDVRLTIIGPDGEVLCDSSVSGENLSGVANHSDRPEFIDAL